MKMLMNVEKSKMLIKVGKNLLPTDWQEELSTQRIAYEQVIELKDLFNLAGRLLNHEVVAVMIEGKEEMETRNAIIARNIKNVDPAVPVVLIVDNPVQSLTENHYLYDTFICKSVKAVVALELVADQKKWLRALRGCSA